MKLPFSFLFLLFIGNINNDISLSYYASTRGSSFEFEISNSILKFSKNQKSGQKKLSKKELKKIDALLSKIDLNAIPTLVPPSTKSHFDGAMAATLIIECNSKKFKSSTFDHGNPPNELKELIDYIFDLIYIDSN
ncbi:hypothetical protein [Urechidicola vernalis]|uniref:Uncharacterized protein n=1 Tax=Urechidicola vernalis TaxID=3075600 RepID=A0ABU2Y7W6_9FLAO|nr:hypothetical protein [Urechidicola sp. P050]MDT0553330.1 hypothetical protein [Urechidicola sp. P050]